MADKPETLNQDFVDEIKAILRQSRLNAYRSVNHVMVKCYWLVGKRIVQEEQKGQVKAAYGEAQLKKLSQALATKLGKGFSYSNLRNFRQFYLTYPHDENCYALRSKLTWTHHRLIMRVDDPKAREYYMKETEEQNWSTRVLERNINSFYYQRLLSSQEGKTDVSRHTLRETDNLDDFVKDPYVFEFLKIPEPLTAHESEIEEALIGQLQNFLLELGKGFSFVGRQIRVSTETDHLLYRFSFSAW